MQIKIDAQANTSQAQAQFAALTSQVEALNKQLAKSAMIPSGGDPSGFARASRAANMASSSFNHALASSGAYRVEQLKINDAVAKHTKLLQDQKLTFREVFGSKNRSLMRSMYQEQLALQEVAVRATAGNVTDGSQRMTIGVPTAVDKSWDTLNNKIGFFRSQLASGSQQLINWGKNTQWAGRQLMAGITMPMAAFGAAAGVMAYKVDQELTRVAKVYDTTANQNSKNIEEQKAAEQELMQVREAGMKTAVYAAREYGAAASDTIATQAELAATGIKGVALQQSTNQVMRISTLGEIDHAVATKALISLQSVLGLTAKQTGDAFNYMNAIENATSLSTEDFATAIPKALGPMKQMGGSLQDLSILLVAMKERGIAAGEGANAIKAMMQRIYRPSQQVRQEWEMLAHIDPAKVVSEEGGKIMQILPRIAEAIKGLNRPDRVKLLAGLFGSQQVSRMSAMLDGIQNMNSGIGQTSRVLDVNAAGWKAWGSIAENELKQRTESISGRFKSALESLKAEMSIIGQPFLEVATTFLKVFTKGAELFNSMPGWAKKGMAIVAMMAALVGPIVMLIGLTANFIGNIGKIVSSSLKWVTTFELLNKSQIAASVSAKLAESKFMNQADAAATAAQRVEGLTLAVQAYAKAMYEAAAVPLPPEMVALQAQPIRPGMVPSSDMPMHPEAVGSGVYTPTPAPVYVPPVVTRRSSTIDHYGTKITNTESDADYAQRVAMAEREAKAAHEVEVTRVRGINASKAQLAIEEKSAKMMNGAAISTGLMAASMGTMMVSSNHTADNIAKYAMLASIGIPAAKGVTTVLKGAGEKVGEIASKYTLAASNAIGLASATGRAAGKGMALKSVMSGVAAGLGEIMGPVGWITLALGATALIAYKWWEHEKAITAEKEAQNRAVISQNNLLSDSLKISQRTPAKLHTTLASDSMSGPTVTDLADELTSTQSGKDLVAAYKSAGSATEESTIITEKYVQVLQSAGGTAQKARKYIEAMFIAAGDGALEAERKADEYFNTIGSTFDKGQLSKLWMDQIKGAYDDSEKSIQEQGTKIGQQLASSIASGGNFQAQGTFDSFTSAISQQWDEAFAGLDEGIRKNLESLGVKTGADFQKVIENWKSIGTSGGMTPADFQKSLGLDGSGMDASQALIKITTAYTQLGGKADALLGTDKAVAKELARQLQIAGDINSMAELRNTWEWKLQTITAQNAKNLYQSRINETKRIQSAGGLLTGLTHISDEQKLQIINDERLALGLGKATSLGQGFKDSMDSATTSIKTAAGAMDGLVIKAGDMAGIRKSGMEGVVGDIATQTSTAFSSSMSNAIDSYQKMWSDRETALQNANQRAQDAFDARWERRKKTVENYYKSRMDNIDKEIKAEEKAEAIRQKIFDAEQSRLSRAAESQNRTIDFNMALQTGNLDEAAKLRNDMEAQAASWALGDAAGNSSTASQARIDRLNNQKDHLDKQRQREQDSLTKREDDERKHLERVQKMREDALKTQADAAIKSYQAEWDARKANLDSQLELFKSFIPKNQEQLKKWMQEMRGNFAEFGDNTVDPMSKKWGSFFKTSFQKNIREAGAKIASDNMWTKLGQDSGREVLQGMGFNSMGKFKKFILTGELPDDFGKKPKRTQQTQPMNLPPRTPSPYGPGPILPGTYHNGGEVDGGMGSGRSGVAENTRGLHPSEQMVRVQKKEFIVNKKAAQEHGPLLRAINDGKIGELQRKGIYGGAVPGVAALVAGATGNMLAAGAARALKNAFNSRVAGAASNLFGTLSAATGTSSAAYVPGVGGKHRPIIGYSYGAIHDAWTGYPAVDFAAPTGTPVYAVADGKVSRSYDITGYEPRRDSYGKGQDGYRSYGRVIYLKTDAGPEVLYAHLSERGVPTGTTVKGGSIIGKSGDTGNSTGPHLHFGSQGASPLAWLKTGGMTLNDGMAMLHRGETVLTEPLTDDLKSTVKAFGKMSKRILAGNPAAVAKDSTRKPVTTAGDWGPETTPVDKDTESMGWTWLSGLFKNLPKTKMATTGSANGDGNVHVGAYNVRFSTNNHATRQDLKKLMGQADVLALSEMNRNKQQVLLPWLATQGWGSQGSDADSVVTWNNSLYEDIDSGEQLLNAYGLDKMGGKRRYAAYARLKNRSTGQSFWQVAAHTISSAQAPERRAVQAIQFASLKTLQERLSKSAPVIVSGDLNQDPRRGNQIKQIGLGAGRSSGAYTMHHSYLDHILASAGLTGLGANVMGNLHSDHNALLESFNIPSHKNGAENIRWDNTLVNLHRKESVLTSEQSDKFRNLANNIDNVATGGETRYDIKMYITEPGASADEIANKVIKKLSHKEGRKPVRRVSE